MPWFKRINLGMSLSFLILGCSSDPQEEFPGIFYSHASRETSHVALTFDDGPSDPETSSVLTMLELYGVKATFFLVGKRAQKFPDIAEKVRLSGHAIGNHTLTHVDLSLLSAGTAWSEQIEPAEELFASILSFRPRLMRPPFGSITDEEIMLFGSKGFKVILWTVDPADWRFTGETPCSSEHRDQIVNDVVRQTRGGAIILLHDPAGNCTLDALPAIIEGIRAKGYAWVTVPELLGVKEEL